MKKILESDKSFYFIVFLAVIIPLIIGISYVLTILYS